MCMKHSILSSVLLAAAAMTLGGCNGPSKAGLEARENAYGRIDKVNTQIAYGQARQAFEVGQLRKALDIIKEAAKRYPKAAEYHLLHARILIELHRLDEASHALKFATEQDEVLPEAYYFLGIVHQRWSEDREAHEHYMKAADLAPDKPQYLLAASEMLVSLQEYEQAEELILGRMRKFEHHPTFHHLLGQIAMLRGDITLAERYYEEASLLQPDDLQVLSELANVQFLAGNVPGCLSTIHNIESRSDSTEQHMEVIKARCLVQTHRYAEARPIYMKLLEANEHDVTLWEESGYLAWTLEDWRGLRNCGQRVASLSPERCAGWLLLAVSDRSEGNTLEARKHLETAVGCADADALCWVILANLREQLGDMPGSKSAWQHAIDHDSTLAEHPRLADVPVGDG